MSEEVNKIEVKVAEPKQKIQVDLEVGSDYTQERVKSKWH